MLHDEESWTLYGSGEVELFSEVCLTLQVLPMRTLAEYDVHKANASSGLYSPVPESYYIDKEEEVNPQLPHSRTVFKITISSLISEDKDSLMFCYTLLW